MAKQKQIRAAKNVTAARRRAQTAIGAFTTAKNALELSNAELDEAIVAVDDEIQVLKRIQDEAAEQAAENAKVLLGINRLLNGE